MPVPDSSYYFGTYPAIALPTDPTSDETVPSDEASLQNQINTLHQNGGGTIKVQTGVGVNGMSYATVSGNTLTFSHVSAGRCPKDDYAAEISAGYAGNGTFSPAPADVDFDGCV